LSPNDVPVATAGCFGLAAVVKIVVVFIVNASKPLMDTTTSSMLGLFPLPHRPLRAPRNTSMTLPGQRRPTPARLTMLTSPSDCPPRNCQRKSHLLYPETNVAHRVLAVARWWLRCHWPCRGGPSGGRVPQAQDVCHSVFRDASAFEDSVRAILSLRDPAAPGRATHGRATR
jgi:hypothetical protein